MKVAIIDRIKYDGVPGSSNWLIHKYPSEQFVIGSQLIVNQGQEALFFKGGEALDLFQAGTHTLCTGNLPILHKLVNLPFGGKTPFSAEIYYINRTANLDMKWGTSTPIPLEDPKYGLILNVGARGQYGIHISDSRLFVCRIIGAIPSNSTADHSLIRKYFNGFINSKIKSITAEYMIQKQISFLEISQYLSELSSVFQEKLNSEFMRFGVEIVNFYCESIVPRQEDYQKLREHKEQLAMTGASHPNPYSSSIENQTLSTTRMDGPAKSSVSNINLNRNIEQTDSTRICSKCGANNPDTMKFCGICGNTLMLNTKCPHCGAHIHSNMNFCGACGRKL